MPLKIIVTTVTINIIKALQKMKRKVYVWMILIGVAFFYSCKNEVRQSGNKSASATTEDKILQKADGTISLKINNAECYQDMSNPASNTAEWNVVVSKSGRYNVWLSSATKDTTNLQYKNAVMFSILDKRIEAVPTCDKVIHNSTEVCSPFFEADSFMGTLYIQDTGLCNVQVISEKIIPENLISKEETGEFNSRLLSVSLIPVVAAH